MNEVYALVSDVLIPIFLILVPAGVGFYFAKMAGFIAGFNIGVMFSVFYLDVPEYFLVAMVIIDVLLYFFGVRTNDI